MNRICWWLVERLSRRLEPGERDAVLGDIAESGESGRGALRDLLGLAVRRQAAALTEARSRDGLALAGLIAPVGMLTGPASWWVIWQLHSLLSNGVLEERAMTPTDDVLRLVCGILLIAGWVLLAVWGVRRGVRAGCVGMGRITLLAAAIATLTLIMQVEDTRQKLAFELWRNGGSLGWQLVWTPHVLPFLAILWQFGILTAVKEKNI
jgi:hypothetical protein